MHTSRLVAYDQILLNAESHPLLIAAMLLRAVEKVGRPHILLQRNMLANMVMFSHGWNLTIRLIALLVNKETELFSLLLSRLLDSKKNSLLSTDFGSSAFQHSVEKMFTPWPHLANYTAGAIKQR